MTCLCLSLTLVTAGLGEFRIRDLNDEINKLLREKGHWEVRIKELGGPDYRVIIQKFCQNWKLSQVGNQSVIACVFVSVAAVRAQDVGS